MGWWAGGSLKNPILTTRGWSRLGWLRSPPHDHLIDGPFSPRLGTGAPPHHRSQPHRQSGSHKQKAHLYMQEPCGSKKFFVQLTPPWNITTSSRLPAGSCRQISCSHASLQILGRAQGGKRDIFIFCWIICPNLLRLWILWWRVFNDGLGWTRSICQHSPARLLQLLASHNNLFFPCWLPRRVSRESFMPIYSKWDKPAAADETLNFYSLHKKR